jgi:hypothetical protein
VRVGALVTAGEAARMALAAELPPVPSLFDA